MYFLITSDVTASPVARTKYPLLHNAPPQSTSLSSGISFIKRFHDTLFNIFTTSAGLYRGARLQTDVHGRQPPLVPQSEIRTVPLSLEISFSGCAPRVPSISSVATSEPKQSGILVRIPHGMFVHISCLYFSILPFLSGRRLFRTRKGCGMRQRNTENQRHYTIPILYF